MIILRWLQWRRGAPWRATGRLPLPWRMRALMVMNLTRRLGSYSGQDAVVSM